MFAVLLAFALNLAQPVPDTHAIGVIHCGAQGDLELRYRDLDPRDADAALYEFWLPTGRVAVISAKTKEIHIDALKQTMTVEVAMRQWPTACSLLQAGR